MAGTASATGTMPQTPPESPAEESDPAFSFDHRSDAGTIIHPAWCKAKNTLQAWASKLIARLNEMGRER